MKLLSLVDSPHSQKRGKTTHSSNIVIKSFIFDCAIFNLDKMWAHFLEPKQGQTRQQLFSIVVLLQL